MRYVALATDYDGTLATDGVVDDATVSALERLRASGRTLVLVSGRVLPELIQVFPRLDLFDRVVAENGALLYRPATAEAKALVDPPPAEFSRRLRERGVGPLSVGQVIVSTWEPHQSTVLDVIHELGLELHVVFNKGAVMVLPSGVNKCTGLSVALQELRLSMHNTVGVGDAENDHAFLSACECAVAVANALPALKQRADLVTRGARGAGVAELIDMLVQDDLRALEMPGERHHLVLGRGEDGQQITLPAFEGNLLVADTTGEGASEMVVGFLERLHELGYQFCLLDPGGRYQDVAGAAMLGSAERAATATEVRRLLNQPNQSVAINLVAASPPERGALRVELLAHLRELRASVGRPHWVVMDEADALEPPFAPSLGQGGPFCLITPYPERLASATLSAIDTVISAGKQPQRAFRAFNSGPGEQTRMLDSRPLRAGEALMWRRRTGETPFRVQLMPSSSERLPQRRRGLDTARAGDAGQADAARLLR